MSVPQWFTDCQDARAKASKTVQVGRRAYVRFLAEDAEDDGTPRCISCGQIDDTPWHKAELCFGLAGLKEPQ